MIHKEGIDLKIESKDIIICYDDLGTEGVPIIFIHGFPFDKSAWKPQMDAFKATNRVITYDIRGFGKTNLGTSDATIGLFAEDLIQFMDELKIDKAIVCGLSMGGYILLNAVDANPDRFAALILCDTQCIGDSEEGKAARKKTSSEIQGGHKSEFADGFLKKAFCQNSIDHKPELIVAIREIIMNTTTAALTGTLSALAERKNMCSSLSKINVPTLIICGELDVITPMAQSETMQKSIKGSELHSIPNAGHLSNLEQPEVFNEILLNFVNSL